MSANSKLYDKVIVKGNMNPQAAVAAKTYKGFSTISPDSSSFALYDYALIKQDLINHFHIRKGERLENPEFGTIIWDILFEPLTAQTREMIVQDVKTVIDYDPRIIADKVTVSQYDTGLQIECALTYLPYYIVEQMQLKFDQANGLMLG